MSYHDEWKQRNEASDRWVVLAGLVIFFCMGAVFMWLSITP